jgi:hypothetical protein
MWTSLEEMIYIMKLPLKFIVRIVLLSKEAKLQKDIGAMLVRIMYPVHHGNLKCLTHPKHLKVEAADIVLR